MIEYSQRHLFSLFFKLKLFDNKLLKYVNSGIH